MGQLRIPVSLIPSYFQPSNRAWPHGSTDEYAFFHGGSIAADGSISSSNALAVSGKLLNATYSRVTLYQGAFPTQAVIDSWDSSSQSVDPRDADALINFTATSCSLLNRNLSIGFNGTANAIRSGTATWFMIKAGSASNINDVLAGSVTLIDGGGDIELTSTSYVSGTSYKLPQLTLALPSRYVF